ncbi:MAG: hypothetical protein ACREGR_04675 [Minisyncoccia bacterium]
MSLSHKVAVYVPSKIKDTKVPKLHRQYTRLVLKRLGLLFGGSTMVKGVGTWVDSRGKLVPERVAICYSFCDESALAVNEGKVFDLARLVARKMQQESVSVEIDGVLHFVGAAEPVAA